MTMPQILRFNATTVKCKRTKALRPVTRFFPLTQNKTIPSPLQALIAEVMSEAARKSVIAIVVETLLWWMFQPGAVCDH